MIVLSLFDGISSGRVALERAGIPITKYYASEIDKYAIKIAQKNYPDTIQLGDINNFQQIGNDHVWHGHPHSNCVVAIETPDLIIGGSPCQGFSFAGKQLAFDDPRSALFWKYVEIVRYYKPKYFLLENVRMKKEHLQVITDALGVEPICINSALVSAQNRVRYYWTNIPNVTQPEDKGVMLEDIIECGSVDRDRSYCLDANYWKGISLAQYYKKCRRQIVFNETVSSGKDDYRILTPVECERLQTLPTWKMGIQIKLCLDQLKNFVTVVNKNPKLLKLVGNVERLKYTELVKNAIKNTAANHQSTKSIVGNLVDMQIKKQTSQCTRASKTDVTEIVNVVVTGTLSQNRKQESFVPLNVFTLGIEEKTPLNGQGEFPQKDKELLILRFGRSALKLCGEEIELPVEDVENILNICQNNNSIYTMLSRLGTKSIEQMWTILYCYANTVIDGCTVNKTKTESILVLQYEVPYTEGISNTQRYRALGNGRTVDVLAHIFINLDKIGG